MGYSLLLFTILCGGGYYMFDHKYINIHQFTFYALLILIIGNIILYFICNKRISYNILNQENL